ncbi:MAG: beta-lactamase family protein [Pseudomonadales bacterium]|nr:beta-lactamase family protein [Pseudomonadales bacterium]
MSSATHLILPKISLAIVMCLPLILFAQSDRYEAAFEAVAASGFDGVAAVSVGGESPRYAGFGRAQQQGLSASQIQVDIGSITKTVTAAAVLHAVDAGLLSVDQTLEDFFADVPDDKAEITVHQLLTHSAGFRGSIGRDSEKTSRDDYIDEALRRPLRFDSGSSYSYSNVGYSLLAAIIEIVSGVSYQEYLLGNFLPGSDQPRLGYGAVHDEARSLRNRRGRTVARVSWGGDQAWWHLIGNGGLVASTEDMLNFLRRLVDGELLSEASQQLMFTPHVREVPDDTYYGYGLVVDTSSRWGDYYWHNGGNGTYHSRWTYLVGLDAVVFAAGLGRPDSDQAAREIQIQISD